MKTIDNLLERIKKEGRSICKNASKKLIIPLTLTTLLTASAKEARADLKKVWQEIKDRTSIEANYSCGKPELNKEFLKQYSDSFATPYFKQYLEQPWQDFEQAKNLQMLGGKRGRFYLFSFRGLPRRFCKLSIPNFFSIPLINSLLPK